MLNLQKLIYENRLSSEADVSDFIMEGNAAVTFPLGRMRLEGNKSNFVFWCPVDFPSDIQVEWDFWPVREPGLCMLFFAASGLGGKDIFDKSLKPRNGDYPCYHDGDIQTFHISYFRRKQPSEIAFHVCNLRKSPGLHMTAQGGDPIPSVVQAVPPYHLKLTKVGNTVSFFIDDLHILEFVDDGKTFGPLLTGGKIGFRQMEPLIGEYANLKIYSI